MRQNWTGRALIRAALAVSIFVCGFLPASAAQDDRPLTVGVLTKPAPYYAFNEATGEPIGFALDLWHEVARRAGLRYRLVFFDTLADIERSVAQKTVDIVPLLAISETSTKLFDFSQTIHQSPVVIFTRKSATGIAGQDDLTGHRVSVVENHIGQTLMRTYRGELSIVHDTALEALSALMTKTTDAVIHQEYIFRQLARQQGIESLLTTVGKPLQQIQLAIAVRKGQPAVVAALTPALEIYLRSGAFYAARSPWGGNPAPLLPPLLIAKVLGALLAIAVVGLALWRHFSVVRLNTALASSVAEKQSAEERFKDLAEAASDWFFEQDENYRFTFVSSRFEDLTGIPTSRLIGQTRWHDSATSPAISGDADWKAHIATLEAHEDWRDFTYTVTSEDGEKRIVSTSGKAIFDNEGRFRGYRGVGRDITNQRALEGALQQAQKMELVGQLTGGIAHDFNNLLTVMVGNLEMLKRNLKDDPKTAVHLSTASEAVDIGAQLVRRLLGFARRQPLNPSLADLNALVSETLPLVRSSVGGLIRVKLHLSAEPTSVYVDAAQLQNALLNLSINARDAMPEGGQIVVETSSIEISTDTAEHYPGAEPGHYFVLRVTDTGSGIEKGDLSKVVEPFYTTKDVGKGTGLGLSSVYGFAKQSNGFLLLDSQINHGTTVSIYLPAADSIPAPLSDLQDPAEPPVDGLANEKTVLVVEDDPNVRALTVSRLQHLGYQVLDADGGNAALATLADQPTVDVLLTDIVMPGGMSGIDLAAKVNTIRPDIKVIFSASYSKQADILHEQGKLGSWLQKPYKQAELAQKMQEILGTA